MLSKKTVLTVSACLLAAAATWTFADPAGRKGVEGQGIQATVTPAVTGVPEVVGTITYDNNVPFQRSAQVDGMVGNRFDMLADPHTLTSVTFRAGGNYGASVVMSVWDPGAGTAMLLRRWLALGVPSGAAATMSTVMVAVGQRVGTSTMVSPVTGHSGSFLAGVRNTWYTGFSCAPPSTGLNTTCDGVALTQGVVAGAPNHGVQLPFVGGSVFIPTVSTFASTGVDLSQNAIMRATGENLPVELMSFGIED